MSLYISISNPVYFPTLQDPLYGIGANCADDRFRMYAKCGDVIKFQLRVEAGESEPNTRYMIDDSFTKLNPYQKSLSKGGYDFYDYQFDSTNHCDKLVYFWIGNAKSEPIWISNDCPNLAMVNYYNSCNGQGIYFESDEPIQFGIQLPIIVAPLSSSDNSEAYLDSKGLNKLVYSNRPSIYEVTIGLAPTWFHRMVEAIWNHQYININGHDFIKESEYRWDIDQRFGLTSGDGNLRLQQFHAVSSLC